MTNLRRHKRVGISFPVECKSLPSQGYFYTVSKDISLGGIRILSSEFLNKEDSLKVHINLINRVLSLKAEVVWCNRERVSERYLTGLRFMELGEANRNELRSFLENIAS